jgi:hypothetical protein
MRPTIHIGVLACTAALAACATTPDSAPGGTTAPNGYYSKVVGGEQLFCRNDLKLGSHVEHEGEKCYTADQLKGLQDANAAAVKGSTGTQHGAN